MQVQISAIGRGQTIENHLLWIVELFPSVLGPNWRYINLDLQHAPLLVHNDLLI